MKHLKVVSLICIFIFTGSSFAQVRPSYCPDNTKESLNAFRDKLAADVVQRATDVQKKIISCYGEDVEKQPACIGNITDDINRKIYNIGDSEMERVSEPSVTLQSEAQLPEEFRVKDARGNFIPGLVRYPPNITEIAKAKGWKVLPYRTRSSGGFDNPPNLTIVAIPKTSTNPVDIMIQISPANGMNDDHHESNVAPEKVNPAKGQNNFTIITVDHSKTPPEGNMRIMKKSQQHPETGGYDWNNRGRGFKSCGGCHTNPMRSISPRGYSTLNVFKDAQFPQGKKETPLTSERSQLTDEINAMMNVPHMTWQKVYVDRIMPDGTIKKIRSEMKPPMEEPPFGWAPPGWTQNQDAFFKECIKNASFTEYSGFGDYTVAAPVKPSNYPEHVRMDMIKSGVSCAKCHNGSERGYLHSEYSTKEMRFKVAVDKRMPPWEGDFEDDGFTMKELNDSERQAVLQCVKDMRRLPEIRNAWKTSGDWLRQGSCEPAKATGTPNSNGISTPGEAIRRGTN